MNISQVEKKYDYTPNERIIWIEATNTNNFNYDISGYIPQDCKNLKVKLSMCYIEYPDANIFNATIVRILCDFGTGHNQFSKMNNYLQLCVINNPSTQINKSIEIIETNAMPHYDLYGLPSILNILILNQTYGYLQTSTSNTVPSRINICLTFSYFI